MRRIEFFKLIEILWGWVDAWQFSLSAWARRPRCADSRNYRCATSNMTRVGYPNLRKRQDGRIHGARPFKSRGPPTQRSIATMAGAFGRPVGRFGNTDGGERGPCASGDISQKSTRVGRFPGSDWAASQFPRPECDNSAAPNIESAWPAPRRGPNFGTSYFDPAGIRWGFDT